MKSLGMVVMSLALIAGGCSKSKTDAKDTAQAVEPADTATAAAEADTATAEPAAEADTATAEPTGEADAASAAAADGEDPAEMDVSGALAAPVPASIKTEEVSYEGGGVKMKGFLAWDSAKEGPRPGVLVVHEWWGHNEYARRRAVMLAELGYTALAVDMYGDGKTADHPADAMKFAGETIANLDQAKARFDAAKKLLSERADTDPARIAAVGYCFGGGVALNMARMGDDLAGVVSFHGSLGAKEPAKKGEVKAEMLVLTGADDPFAPPEMVKAFEDEMKAADAHFLVVSYPGAKHAFTNPDATEMGKKFDLPLAYDAKVDAESWDAMKAFLARVFAK